MLTRGDQELLEWVQHPDDRLLLASDYLVGNVGAARGEARRESEEAHKQAGKIALRRQGGEALRAGWVLSDEGALVFVLLVLAIAEVVVKHFRSFGDAVHPGAEWSQWTQATARRSCPRQPHKDDHWV